MTKKTVPILCLFLLTAFIQIRAQNIDTALARYGQFFALEKTVQFWRLAYSHSFIMGKVPENMSSLCQFASQSIVDFDSNYISNYKYIDEKSFSVTITIACDTGCFSSDSVKIEKLTIENAKFEFDLRNLVYMSSFMFEGDLRSAQFVVNKKEITVENIKLDNQSYLISTFEYKKRYIKIDNPYPENSPEFMVLHTIEKLRNDELQQYCTFIDPEQLRSAKNIHRQLFSDDYTDSIRNIVLGVKTEEEFDKIPDDVFMYNVFFKKMAGILSGGVIMVSGNPKILGTIKDGDSYYVMYRMKMKVFGKLTEGTEKIEVKNRNGKYYIRLNDGMEAALTSGFNLYKKRPDPGKYRK